MNETKAFVAQIQDDTILSKSSSGGLFYYLASWFINNGGIVYGASLNETDGLVYHKRVASLNELEPILRSKYVESNIEGIYEEIKSDLVDSKKVLFSGTPCQVALIVSQLKKDKMSTSNILLIDLICHGTPAKEYWRHYISSFFNPPFNVNFRDKKTGWNTFSVTINEHSVNASDDIYYNLFIKNYLLLEKCYHCNFKGENRFSDLTLGDAWGIESYLPSFKNIEKGVSLILVRNNKCNVNKALEKLNPIQVDYIKSTYNSNSCYFKSVAKPTDKENVINRFLTNTYTIKNNGGPREKHNKLLSKIKGYIRSVLLDRLGINTNYNKKYDVGIITLDGYYNFGNRLQNFALHTLLRQHGYKTTNIDRTLSTRPFTILRNKKIDKRTFEIYRTSRKYERKHYIYNKKQNLLNIHTLLIGSDQVWNYHYSQFIPHTLGFNINHPNIHSYAASFGFDKMNKVYTQLYKESLSKIKNISVREKTGLNIVNELGFIGNCDLDPTLLLDIDAYNQAIAKYSKIKLPNKDYILKYMLAGETIENNGGIQIIDILDKESDYYNINQFDFINLIKHAKYIITNSFHGTVFSLLFGKKIYLYKTTENKEMFSRFSVLFDIVEKCHERDVYYILEENDFNNKIERLKKESIKRLIKEIK